MHHHFGRWHRETTVLPLFGARKFAQLGSSCFAPTDVAVGDEGSQKQARAKSPRRYAPPPGDFEPEARF